MGQESRIEPWSPHLTAFCFAGFGTDRLRREEVMKTTGRENPNRWGNASSNRAHGAEVQNRSCSIMWAGKQEKIRPLRGVFFLDFPFYRTNREMTCCKEVKDSLWMLNRRHCKERDEIFSPLFLLLIACSWQIISPQCEHRVTPRRRNRPRWAATGRSGFMRRVLLFLTDAEREIRKGKN